MYLSRLAGVKEKFALRLKLLQVGPNIDHLNFDLELMYFKLRLSTSFFRTTILTK